MLFTVTTQRPSSLPDHLVDEWGLSIDVSLATANRKWRATGQPRPILPIILRANLSYATQADAVRDDGGELGWTSGMFTCALLVSGEAFGMGRLTGLQCVTVKESVAHQILNHVYRKRDYLSNPSSPPASPTNDVFVFSKTPTTSYKYSTVLASSIATSNSQTWWFFSSMMQMVMLHQRIKSGL